MKLIIDFSCVSGSKTELRHMNTKFLDKIANYRSDLVSKSSSKTIMSIKNGMRNTLTNKVIYVWRYESRVVD